MQRSSVIHPTIFWVAAAALPMVGFVRSAVNPSGDSNLWAVAIIFTIYAAFFALMFFPSYIEATRNCDRVGRGISLVIGSMALAHIVAIGGAILTDSNSFLFAYPAVATASLLVLRNTSVCAGLTLND